jgi:hypothetical protein
MKEFDNLSIASKAEVGKNSLVQNQVLKETIFIMGDEIAYLDIENENLNNKVIYLERELGVIDKDVVNKMCKLEEFKIKDISRNERTLRRLTNAINRHKQISDK